MFPVDQETVDAPEVEAPEVGTPADDATPEPAAPQQPAYPPELVDAVASRVVGELRTVHGEMRRQGAELRAMFQQLQTSATSGSNQALDALREQIDTLNDSYGLLTQHLLPEEQQAAIKQQRELNMLRRQVDAAKRAPSPAPAAPPSPTPAPDADVQQQLALAGLRIQEAAEALDINLQTLTDAERALVQADVPTTGDVEAMVRGIKANLKKLAAARKAPTPEARQDATREAVRATTVAPAARGGTASRPANVRQAEQWLAEGRISPSEFYAYGFS